MGCLGNNIEVKETEKYQNFENEGIIKDKKRLIKERKEKLKSEKERIIKK